MLEGSPGMTGSCWCPRCREEGTFHVDTLKRCIRLICGTCGFSTSHAYCADCQMQGPIQDLTQDSKSEWTCKECGIRHPLAADYTDHTIVFSLRHQGEEAPPKIKTGIDAWRGVIRMVLILGMFIWIYYQFIFDWPQ